MSHEKRNDGGRHGAAYRCCRSVERKIQRIRREVQPGNTEALTVDGNGFVTAVGEGKACKQEKTSSFRLILNETAGRRQDFLPPFSMRSTLIDCILK